ncbi:YcxB family protein [Novipirellula sp. SH528]|uniref:YcxB family protein n=1 Tax=Novipirellula sp. SH528 TaxID=3454466 RepID=UPI003F9F969F
MKTTTNPYCPATVLTGENVTSDDSIQVSGEVFLKDIALLMPTPLVLHVVRLAFVVIVAPLWVLGIALMIKDGIILETTVYSGFVTLLSALGLVANWLVSRSRRAHRLVKTSRGLLGPIEGVLDAQGFTFLNSGDGKRHRVSWRCFPVVAVNRHGIRLDWNLQNGNFIAIPARCIEAFPALRVRSMIEAFRAADETEASYRIAADWNDAPPDAIRFELTTRQRPAQPPTKLAIYYLVIVAMLVTGAIAFWLFVIERTYLASAVGIGCLFLISAYTSMRQTIVPAIPELQWNQWGWLTEDACFSEAPGSRRSVPWSEVDQIVRDDETLTIVMPDNSTFAIPRTGFLDGGWADLDTKLQSLSQRHQVTVKKTQPED